MKTFLGLDTSNYTSSAALYFENGEVFQTKKLLPVKEGTLGLRQSDAVFHHTKQFHEVVSSLMPADIKAVGVSDKPVNKVDSYMPCFLVGVSVGEILASAFDVPIHRFSHQQGHIAAALYDTKKIGLFESEFIALHLSGGTSEVLYVDSVLGDITVIAKSIDLNAGQVVDRVGNMLGLPFPSGRYLEELALKSEYKHCIKPSLKGYDFALSGIENLCAKMMSDGKDKEEIASFCLEYIILTIDNVLEKVTKEYRDVPIIFSGGVSSSSIMKKRLRAKYGASFASPQFSSDNAAGIAVLTAFMEKSL